MKTIIIASVLAIGLLACTDGSQQNDTTMQATLETVAASSAIDQTEIISLMKTLFNETDNHNWESVKQTMADSVYVDYTALGGDAGFKTPNEIVSGWQSLLPGFEGQSINHITFRFGWPASVLRPRWMLLPHITYMTPKKAINGLCL
ncbi:MAG: hypothetical protein AAGF85_12905 [Bacteroidota bacterium]